MVHFLVIVGFAALLIFLAYTFVPFVFFMVIMIPAIILEEGLGMIKKIIKDKEWGEYTLILSITLLSILVLALYLNGYR